MRVVAAPDFTTLGALLAREIDAVRREALTPLTVVVARDALRAELRERLARDLGGLLAVDVVPWARWIGAAVEDAIARAGGHLLSDAGFERLVARVLLDRSRTRAGAALREAAAAPGTARVLAATFSDLLEGDFTAEHVARIPFAPRDVVRREVPALTRDLADAISSERLFDRRRQERLAAEPARIPATPLFLWGFHDFTPLQLRVVEAHAAHRPVVLFVPGPSPRGEAGESAVEPLLSWARERGARFELAAAEATPVVTLEEGLFEGPAIRDPGTAALRIARYGTESAEVRGIAGRILDEVAGPGRSFRDFLVTIPADFGPGALLFRRIFAKARIPLVDAAGVPAWKSPGGRRALLLARAQGLGAGGLEFLAPAARADEGAGAAAEEFLRARDGAETVARFRELQLARLGEPPAEEVEEALTAIERVHGSRPLRPREFAAGLRAALGSIRVRDKGGDGVLLIGRDAARGFRRPVVFHAGLVRGTFRRPAAEDPVLRDAVRRDLTDRFAHEGRRLRLAEERRSESLLLARFALETASEVAILSFAERDRTGGEIRNPSGLLLDLARTRAGRPLEADDLRAMGSIRSEERERPVDLTALDIARFVDSAPTAEDLLAVLDEPRGRHLPRVLRAAESRWSDPRLGPWDGVLEDARARAVLEGSLEGRSWSASALERMTTCPFSFLLNALGLGESDDDPDDFDARERGQVFHDLIARLYAALAEDGLFPLSPESLPGTLAALDAWHRRERDRLAHEPALRRLQRRATLAGLRNDAALVLAHEAHRAPADRTTPVAFESSFGSEPDRPGPAFPLPGGALPLRGRVDRVDRRADGQLEVIDFKTGRKRAKSGKLRREEDGKVALQLQMPIYMEALSQLLRAPVARAILYHATADQEFSRIEYSAGDLARDRAEIGRILAHVVDRAKQGWFPCTPNTERCCYASLARACGPAVAERFVRKRGDPELAAHLAILAGADSEVAAERAGEDAP